MARTRMNIHAYVDFDGTIMPCDTTDLLLERFALPAWHEVEDEWAAGRIGSRECMSRQIELLRVTREELIEAVAALDMDPGFAGFLAACGKADIGVTVVSDGLDLVIETALRRHGLDVPFRSNRLVAAGEGRWRLEFPNARPECAVGAGHCKCARIAENSDRLAVVIGDGRSDFCIADRADLVIAKAKLLEECQANGTPHFPFRDFDEVTEILMGWLDAGSIEQRQRARVPQGA